MPCWCGAGYAEPTECPRCQEAARDGADSPAEGEPDCFADGDADSQFDGPDELLAYLAELEAAELSAAERADAPRAPLAPLDAEDDAPTERMDVLPPSCDAPRRYESQTQCPCTRWLPYALTAPAGDVRDLSSGVRLECPCGIALFIVYSWGRGCVTAVRIERRGQTN